MQFYPSNDWGERITFHEATERSMDLTHVHGSRFLHLNFQLARHKEMLIDETTARQLIQVLDHFVRHGQLPRAEAPWMGLRAFI